MAPQMKRRQLFKLAASIPFVNMVSTPSRAAEPFTVFASDAEQVEYKYRKREVDYQTTEPAGSIVVDTKHKYLYFTLGNNRAMRYGIGVGREGALWAGGATVKRKAKWPTWTPTPEMLAIHENYKQWINGMPGGPDNPLGARAMYLIQDSGIDQSFRIHGTPAPKTIGQAATSGCFRMLNIDVIDLYDRVEIGTRVVVPEKGANKSQSLFGL
jgi:lipoprotein-anchoring transpeptidase ErfK/SrfK